MKCGTCKHDKEEQEFQSAYDPSVLVKTCKSCRARVLKSNRKRIAEVKEKQGSVHQFTRFGISPEQYQEMLTQQDGGCAICHTLPEERLHVDHNHTTGKIRGLLCRHCNTGLGMFKDDPVRLEEALKYLAANP